MSEWSDGNSHGKKPRPRWYQFSLRTLLLVLAVAAGLAMVWRVHVEPYRRQRQTMALIEELAGTYGTVECPKWLSWVHGQEAQNLDLVNLADCDDPTAYLDAVAALPALRTLAVGGPRFTDEHLGAYTR